MLANEKTILTEQTKILRQIDTLIAKLRKMPQTEARDCKIATLTQAYFLVDAA